MRVLNNILTCLLTFLILLLGLFLPGFVTAVQNKRLVNNTQQYPVETVQLAFSSSSASLIDTLRLFSGVYQTLDLPTGSALTEDDARQLAVQAAHYLAASGVLSDKQDFAAQAVSPVLAFAENGAHSAIVWHCALTSAESEITLYLDDATGKMVSVQYIGVVNETNTTADSKFPQNWAELCADYYALKLVGIEEPLLAVMQESSHTLMPSADTAVYDFYFAAEDGSVLTLRCQKQLLTHAFVVSETVMQNDMLRQEIILN